MKKCFLALSLLGILLLAGCQKFQPSGAVNAPASARIDPSRYYAVLLANGSVYFGHLDGLGTDFPVLQDVYYVQSTKDPQTNAVKNILVKRGKEWHGPDRMIVNQKAIVFIEPVGIDSQVAKLIEESKR